MAANTVYLFKELDLINLKIKLKAKNANAKELEYHQVQF